MAGQQDYGVVLNGREIEYEILRSRRKSVGLLVTGPDRLTVRAPLRTSQKEIRALLLAEAPAIERLFARYRLREEQRKQAEALQEIFLFGRPLQVAVQSRPGGGAVKQEGTRITVYSEEPENPEKTKALLRKWAGEQMLPACGSLNERVCGAFRNAGYAVPLARVTVKNMKSRWGSCKASEGKLSINLRLAHFPPECLESVFFHEYAHFLYQDHGPRFYALLRAMYPDYDRAQIPLKRESLRYCGWY